MSAAVGIAFFLAMAFVGVCATACVRAHWTPTTNRVRRIPVRTAERLNSLGVPTMVLSRKLRGAPEPPTSEQ